MTYLEPNMDLRQSPDWARFMKYLGWDCVSTSSGIKIYLKKTFLGTLSKISRPKLLDEKDLKEIDFLCKKNKCLFVKIEAKENQDISLFQKFGYKQSLVPLGVSSTIYIDLKKSEDDLWKAISHSAKYSINRSKREGNKVYFYVNPSEELMKQYYDVVKETGLKKHFIIYPFQEHYEKVKVFGEKSYVFFIKDEAGNILGTKLFLGCSNSITFYSGGTSELGRKTKAGYQLLWECILYFKSLGYEVMDLEGKDDDRFPMATKKWRGFAYFKEKFHGEIVEFPYPYVKYYNFFLKIFAMFSYLQI